MYITLDQSYKEESILLKLSEIKILNTTKMTYFNTSKAEMHSSQRQSIWKL